MASYVEDIVARLIAALEPDDVVLGGGNVKKLKDLPPGCRAGSNASAFRGGFRIWEPPIRPVGSVVESVLVASVGERETK